MKLFDHSHDPEGPPCRHMEGFLQRTADGSAGPVSRWYAHSHAARCGRCSRFLDRLGETLRHLRAESSSAEADGGMPPEARARLDAGAWRRVEPAAGGADPGRREGE